MDVLTEARGGRCTGERRVWVGHRDALWSQSPVWPPTSMPTPEEPILHNLFCLKCCWLEMFSFFCHLVFDRTV